MNNDSRTIDDIVAGVLRQLGTSTIVRAEEQSGNTRRIEATVLTEEVLREQSAGAGHLVLRNDAVITPSGRDWLRQHKITWERTTSQQPVRGKSQVWHLILSEKSEMNEKSAEAATQLGWTIDRTDSTEEVAVTLLSANSTCGAIVLSEQPERIACRVNRNSRVRAAVVHSVEDVKRVKQQLGANLLALSTSERSYFEVRNLFKAIAAGGPPTEPANW